MKKKKTIFCLFAIILALIVAMPVFTQEQAPPEAAAMNVASVELPLPTVIEVQAPKVEAVLTRDGKVATTKLIIETVVSISILFVAFTALLEFKELKASVQKYCSSIVTTSGAGDRREFARSNPGSGSPEAAAAPPGTRTA